MYCPNCGMQIPDSARFCEHCGTKTELPSGGGIDYNDRRMASIMVNKKNEALALILSLLIPGLGQIYNGQTSKGIMIIVAIIVIAVLTAVLLFPMILYIILWIYAMYDAFKEAKEYNQYLLSHDGNPPW